MNTNQAKIGLFCGSALFCLSSLGLSTTALADGEVHYNNGGATGNAANFYFNDNSSRVGIGTATPARLLHVKGNVAKFERNVNSAGFLIHHTGAGGVEAAFGQDVIAGEPWFIIKWLDAVAGYPQMMKVHLKAPENSFVIDSAGNVGLGILAPTHQLTVNGTIRSKEVQVDNTGWPDYVFTDSYELQSLSDLEKYINDNGHLPGIPSAEHVKANGVGVGEMSAKLLEKVEELTLHVIALERKNRELEQKIQAVSAN